MVLKTSSLLVSLLSLVPFISTTPIPDLPMDDCSHWTDTYSVTSQTKYVAWPRLVTGVTVVGCNGCSISDTNTYSVSVTVTTGTDLNIAQIVGAGVTASISIATTTGESIAASLGCPAGTVCGLMARPSYYLVKGVKTSTPGDIVCGKPKTENYEISLPILVQGASKAAQAEVLYSACYTPAGRPKKPIPGYDWPICPAPIETKKGGPRQ